MSNSTGGKGTSVGGELRTGSLLASLNNRPLLFAAVRSMTWLSEQERQDIIARIEGKDDEQKTERG